MQSKIIDTELGRLSTFTSWPTFARPSPMTLARHGFVHDNVGCAGSSGVQTRCVRCQLVVDNWQRGDNPAEVHRLRSPDCPGVLESHQQAAATESICRLQSNLRPPNSVSTRSPRRNATLNTAATAAVGGDGRETDEYDAYEVDGHQQSSSPSSGLAALAASMSVLGLHSAGTPLAGTGSSSTLRPSPSSVSMTQSPFLHPHPPPHHHQHPGAITASYIATAATNSDGSRPTPTEVAAPQASTRPGSDRPSRHPIYSELQKRIESFRHGRVSQGQTAERLAAAGFFYVGPCDNVRCFQCDGGLKNFQPTDDPWTEHVRWFPRCPFVLQYNNDETSRCRTSPQQHRTANFPAAAVERPATLTVAAAAAGAVVAAAELEENRQLREARTCKICMDRDVDTVFLPCGHLVSCSSCAPSLQNCAICRALIRGTVKVFLS